MLVFVMLITLACSNEACGDKTAKKNKANRQLIAAAEKGNTVEVRRLLDSNADVNASATYDAPSPDHPGRNETRTTYALAQAAQEGHLKVVQLLFTHKARIDVRRSDGGTPLALATHFLKDLQLTSGHEHKALDNAPLTMPKQHEYEKIIALLTPKPSTMTMIDAPGDQQKRAQQEVARLLALRDASLQDDGKNNARLL